MILKGEGSLMLARCCDALLFDDTDVLIYIPGLASFRNVAKGTDLAFGLASVILTWPQVVR